MDQLILDLKGLWTKDVTEKEKNIIDSHGVQRNLWVSNSFLLNFNFYKTKISRFFSFQLKTTTNNIDQGRE